MNFYAIILLLYNTTARSNEIAFLSRGCRPTLAALENVFLLYTDVCFTENLPPDAASERISGCKSLDHLSFCNYDIARQLTFTFNAACSTQKHTSLLILVY
jgi:hypothetical protein